MTHLLVKQAFRLTIVQLLFACSSGGTPGDSSQPIMTQGKAIAATDVGAKAPTSDQLRTALTETGFTVQEGRFEAADLSQCCLPGRTCVGNNPSTPYLEYFLPSAPGQTAENPDRDGSPSDIPADMTPAWRMRADEALVYLGKTPPPSVYFSWDFYLFSRQNGDTREIRWDSLRDSLNAGTVWTQGTPRGASGNPSDSPTVVIMTADQGTASSVRSTLIASGFPEDIINVYEIPSSKVTFGLEQEADVFNVLFRVGLFENTAEGVAWIQKPDATLLRLTPCTQNGVQPFEALPPRAHATGVSEHGLEAAVERLRKAILRTHASAGVRPLQVEVLNDPNNPPCIDSDKNCLADSRDTNYLISEQTFLPERDGAFLVAYGVNHQATGKAWYANLTVYHTLKLLGVVSADSRSFPGSAEEYLPNDPEAPMLYAWKFARSCQGALHCTEVPASACPGLPIAAPAAIAIRTYVDPMTLAAPALSELVLDRVLYVDGRE